MYPYGYRPGANGARYPLIVSNHGGPHSADRLRLRFQESVLRGERLLRARHELPQLDRLRREVHVGDVGRVGHEGRPGRDLRHRLRDQRKYPIDRTKVATIGHSYGGFMTNWLITQYPDRFAAAASGAGIANWISDYGNADISRTKETEFFGAPWDPKAREPMIKQSPLMYANRVKTPTLFINGEIDQARAVFREASRCTSRSRSRACRRR